MFDFMLILQGLTALGRKLASGPQNVCVFSLVRWLMVVATWKWNIRVGYFIIHMSIW